MIDFQLAPFIIAGLLVVTGYMFTRWLSNLGELRHWKAITESLVDDIDAMYAEGCAAMGALENIFNGVTAGGMPHSKLVKRIADVATDALLLCAPCEHKEDVERLGEDVVEALAEVEHLAGELIVAKRNCEGWQNLAIESEARMEEAERLLGLANEQLIVLQSEQRVLSALRAERTDG